MNKKYRTVMEPVACSRYILTNREYIFLIAIVLKIIVLTISISVIPTMVGEDTCYVLFKIMTCSSYSLIIYLLVTGTKISVKEFTILLIIFSSAIIGCYFAGTGILLTLIYLCGAKDIRIEKVFHYVGIIYVILFLGTIFGSLIGLIENWDFFQLSSRPRLGLGYSYPTHTSSVLFMSILIVCYLFKKRMNIFWVIILEFLNYWVFRYTDSRAGFILSAVVIIAFWLTKFRRKETTESKVDWMLQWSFPVCAGAIILMTILYKGTGILQIVNRLLSSRLSITQNSIEQYRVHLFGQKIQWIGWGGWGHTQMQLWGEYNFVDTSYIKLLLENGVIVWAIIMILWVAVCIKAYKTNNRYLLYALAFLAVYCIVEQWLMNFGGNPFIIFLGLGVFGDREMSNIIDRSKSLMKQPIQEC